LQKVLAETPAIELAKEVPPFKFTQWDGKVLREIPRLIDRQNRKRWVVWKEAPVLEKRCRGWRHGMGPKRRSANFDEPLPFGPPHPVTVMWPRSDPMSFARRRGG